MAGPFERLTLYCACGFQLPAPTLPTSEAVPVTCSGCGQVSRGVFWRQQALPVVWYDAARVTPEQQARLEAGDMSVLADLPKDVAGTVPAESWNP